MPSSLDQIYISISNYINRTYQEELSLLLRYLHRIVFIIRSNHYHKVILSSQLMLYNYSYINIDG